MAKLNRWLLPEGVEEVLPKQAAQIEHYRRKVLDLYHSYGYQLVIPPLIEYTESLLINTGSDMDLQTFKVTDQLTGRMMAVRADITPQTARIDAHSLKNEGPTRLCYAGTVLQTKPKSQLASRTPIEAGAELYGDASLASDIEVINLMLESVALAGHRDIHLDLGHVGIFRALVAAAGFDEDTENMLRDAFNRKAKDEVNTLMQAQGVAANIANMLVQLLDLHGDSSVLAQAKAVLAGAPESVLQAIADLQFIAERMQQLKPEITLFFDLGELRGYQYHTGLVFAALIDGVGHAVANGGRFDGIGEAFGRARPATGFSANVKAILQKANGQPQAPRILAPALANNDQDISLLKAINALRQQGNIVVQALPQSEDCGQFEKQLILQNGQWQLSDC